MLLAIDRIDDEGTAAGAVVSEVIRIFVTGWMYDAAVFARNRACRRTATKDPVDVEKK